MEYDAIIFDNDGVLVTPTDRSLWRRASRLALQDLGVEEPLAADLDRVDGYSIAVLVRACERYGVNADAFWERRETYAARAQARAMWAGTKTTYDDVDTLATLEPAVGIVSNNQQATIEFVVDHFGLDCVETSYGREPTVDGLVRMKPNSHYLGEAVADLEAVNPLYVGDSGVDMAAAADLGIDSAFVRRPHRRDYEPTPAPTHEVASLSALRELVGSPAPA